MSTVLPSPPCTVRRDNSISDGRPLASETLAFSALKPVGRTTRIKFPGDISLLTMNAKSNVTFSDGNGRRPLMKLTVKSCRMPCTKVKFWVFLSIEPPKGVSVRKVMAPKEPLAPPALMTDLRVKLIRVDGLIGLVTKNLILGPVGLAFGLLTNCTPLKSATST